MAPPVHLRGNALFIILIAVALFAALSYAVTQSGRDGASADRERIVLDAAQVMQYAALLNSTVQRMVLTGTHTSDLVFCSSGDPATYCEIDADDVCTTGVDCVFAPEGGGMPPAPRYVHPNCNPIAGVGGAPGECPWFIDPASLWGWDPAAFGTAADDVVLLLLDAPSPLRAEIQKRQFGSGVNPGTDIDDVYFKTVLTPFSTVDLGMVLVVR